MSDPSQNSGRDFEDWLFAPSQGGTEPLDASWELLNLYRDGEATPLQAAEVEALLGSDPSLARDFMFMDQLGTAVRGVERLDPPTSLCESILAQTSHRPTFSRKALVYLRRLHISLPPLRWSLAGACAVTAGLVVFAIGRYGVSAPHHGTAGTGANLVASGATHRLAPVAAPLQEHRAESRVAKATPESRTGAYPRSYSQLEEGNDRPASVLSMVKGSPGVDRHFREFASRYLRRPRVAMVAAETTYHPVKSAPVTASSSGNSDVTWGFSGYNTDVAAEDKSQRAHEAMAAVVANAAAPEPDTRPADPAPQKSVAPPPVPVRQVVVTKPAPIPSGHRPLTLGEPVPPDPSEFSSAKDFRTKDASRRSGYTAEVYAGIQSNRAMYLVDGRL